MHSVHTALFFSGLYTRQDCLGAGGEEETDISPQSYFNLYHICSRMKMKSVSKEMGRAGAIFILVIHLQRIRLNKTRLQKTPLLCFSNGCLKHL